MKSIFKASKQIEIFRQGYLSKTTHPNFCYFGLSKESARRFDKFYQKGIVEIFIPDIIYEKMLRGCLYEEYYDGKKELELKITPFYYGFINNAKKVYYEYHPYYEWDYLDNKKDENSSNKDFRKFI